MYLKSIEVHGFKSFAEKIKFEFHNGITGIVGPNGSGKSNVADAVRWVLGEQSAKQLRGASMQDVIFSGTELRKQMGFAYVAITLDNSDHKLPTDYDEVTVSRRVYRSGESEYLINGIACRLKDVHEMFYDTGIGKEGYSIIGQGQIDKILSGKPEDRRELFDEAAGIVKFKRRKAESIRKLEHEQANLVRVNDILSELERQVGPLKEQSDAAKDYLDKKERLKRYDINLFLLDQERMKGELSGYEEKLSTAQSELEKVKDEYEKSRSEFDSLSGQLKELEEEIEKKREALSQTGMLKEKLEGQIRLSREKINSAKENIEILSGQRDTSAERKEQQEKELSRLTGTISELSEGLSRQTAENDEKKEALKTLRDKIEELNRKIAADRDEIVRIVNERARIQEDIGRFDTMLEQTRLRQAELQSQLIKAKSDEAEHEKNMESLYTELNEVSSEILKLDQEIAERDAGLKQYKGKLEQKDQELQEAQLAYHRKKSRLDTMRNIAERYEGYTSSTRRVMEQKDSGNNRIIGVVADILKVDKEYETAIETALGGNIQNIITEDDDTAKRMIRFLKDNRAGRATFLPLTSVRGRGEYKRPEVRNEPGFIGIASELVHVDSKFNEVVSQLLGEILVVDKYDNARNMARKYNQLLRIVTLEGEYFTPGGAVAGGSFQNNSNLLGRKREIDQLTGEIDQARSRIDQANSDIEAIKAERTKERNAIEELRDRFQELSLRQNTAQNNIDSANKRKEELKQDFKTLSLQSDDLVKQLSDIAGDKEEIHLKIEESKQQEKALNEEISALGKELVSHKDEESRQILVTSDMEVKLNTSLRDMEHTRKDAERVSQEIERLTEEISEITEKIRGEEEDIRQREQDIEEINKTIAASGENQDESEEELKEAIGRKDELSRRQAGLFKLSEELQGQISSFDKEIYRLNAQSERLTDEQEKQINYMWAEYEMTLTKAQGYREEELVNPVSIRRNISELKNQIRDLGDVNVSAIEQYKEVAERYDFLKKQHDDLIEAEKTLNGIIADLDTAMRNQFSEKFSEIAQEFDKVFKELFGGGTGTVRLEENEDILEAGIKVIAQPPGKKLQNMMQLSGGEKALTAIALLFAIQNLKPSPFCLLDEIEAALDESNVGRFAGYLNKLTEHTQFIVITHRRGTMEKADRLYGITMQEKGVSALVSVSLIDKDLED